MDAFSTALAAEDEEEPELADAKVVAAPSTRAELWEVVRLAVPTAVANLLEYLPVSFDLYFVGRSHASSAGLDLDAMSLGRSYFNMTCFSVSYGLISAMRTLCPQAVGGGKGRELHGLYAQRALCVVSVGSTGGVAGMTSRFSAEMSPARGLGLAGRALDGFDAPHDVPEGRPREKGCRDEARGVEHGDGGD